MLPILDDRRRGSSSIVKICGMIVHGTDCQRKAGCVAPGGNTQTPSGAKIVTNERRLGCHLCGAESVRTGHRCARIDADRRSGIVLVPVDIVGYGAGVVIG
jgi:hypothetical protein